MSPQLLRIAGSVALVASLLPATGLPAAMALMPPPSEGLVSQPCGDPVCCCGVGPCCCDAGCGLAAAEGQANPADPDADAESGCCGDGQGLPVGAATTVGGAAETHPAVAARGCRCAVRLPRPIEGRMPAVPSEPRTVEVAGCCDAGELIALKQSAHALGTTRWHHAAPPPPLTVGRHLASLCCWQP